MSRLLRAVRLVALPGPSPTAPEHPVDVLVGDDGRVLAVGARLERPAGAEEVAAEGRWLMPGLWDAHVHLGQWTAARARLDTRGVTSAVQAVDLVRARLATHPGEAVVGWGHRPAGWPEPPLTSALDALGAEVAVVLIAGDGHHAWLNTIARRALGLPPGQDVVAEADWFEAYTRLPAFTGDPTTPAAYRRTLADAAADGVVGVVDLEFAGGLAGWRERWDDGCDLLRVRVGVYAEDLDATIAEGLRTGAPLLPGARGAERLTMGPLKIISDGSLTTRTAWCHHPYAGESPPGAAHGAANLEAAELLDLQRRAMAAGLEVATHAIGDAAVTQALDAYAASGAAGSLEHVQLITREDVDRLASLGLRASVQPAHLLDDRDLTEAVWPGRAERCFALRWLHDAGVPLALGSDAPVSPLDPWLAVDAAVRRSGDERDAWHGEQALTRAEALAASTDGRGTVRPGDPADLVLLDDDPLLAVRPGVALTLVAGEVVHRAL